MRRAGAGQWAGQAGLAPPPSHLTNGYAAIQLDQSVRLWRMNADKVQQRFM